MRIAPWFDIILKLLHNHSGLRDQVIEEGNMLSMNVGLKNIRVAACLLGLIALSILVLPVNSFAA